jgi:hypothetical protein
MFSSLPPARRRVIIWMALGAVAVVLLAWGLGTFTLQPGKTFALPMPNLPATANTTPQVMPGGDVFLMVMRGILAVLLVLVPITIVAALFNKESRKRMIANLIAVGILLLLMNQIQPSKQDVVKTLTPPPDSAGQNGPLGILPGAPLPPLPPAPSDTLVLFASIALVLLGIGLAAFLGRRWLFPTRLAPMEKIAREADRARSELSGGSGVEDAIIRTYRQMNKIVAEARELHRPAAATPHEFEEFLVEKGMPAEPLSALTHLFEEVRYGGLVAGSAERQKAIDSLTAIAAACRADNTKLRQA